MKTGKSNTGILLAIAFVLVILVLGMKPIQRLIINLWFLTTAKSTYYIPPETNILSFNPILMNQGSGEWWVYAEDGVRAYHMHPDSVDMYYLIPLRLLDSPGPVDLTEWPKKDLSIGKRKKR